MSETKIAIVYETVFPEFKGGVERWFLFLASKLDFEGFEVHYLNTNGITEIRNNVSFIDIGKNKDSFHFSGKRTIKETFSYSKALFRYLRENDFDFVYMSSFPFLHIWVAHSIQVWKKKKYKTIVDWFEFPSFKFWNREFGLHKGWIGYGIQVITSRMPNINITYLDSTYSQLSKRKVKGNLLLRLPGICPEVSDKIEIIQNKGAQDLCQIGRLIPDKNPLISLNLVSELINLGWQGNFHFIGSGPMREDLQRIISQRNLGSRVFLEEHADDDYKNLILQNCAALIHPSIREGYGLVIIEAAAIGVPAILIRNRDNKSTELGISPSLIAENCEISTLAPLVLDAIRNRETLSRECIRWVQEESPKMAAEKSVLEIANLMRRYPNEA